MKNIVNTINEAIQDRGFSIAELSKYTGGDTDRLKNLLNGKRKMKSDELLNLCYLLNLHFSDFQNV